MSKILVTGWKGFLGRNLEPKLEERRHEIIRSWGCLDDLTTALTNIHRAKPDVVIHLAAKCGGIGANQATPADFASNTLASGLNVLKACATYKVPKLVM